ncbi:hypothetical protein EXIGLDRAFT_723122 [Exidia glandulosa HHB12029]|uniref:C2 domain-containing protein n=1 Tax=Exidia glandulosa HHB12029 TaxID=1314781 RepID=A0A165MYR6_EXIGL|nr:hypothetical protein EXIGLDRAFT_723122 [Exidia glandulosa HHB12029]
MGDAPEAITQATAPTISGTDEKKALMDRSQGPPKKPTEQLEEQGLRTVRDPITGAQVEVEDSVPARDKSDNILFKPFPPAVDAELRPITDIIDKLIIGVPVLSAALLLSSGFSITRATLLGACAIGAAWALGVVRERIPREVDRMRAAMARDRAQSIQPPAPESTEWVNALLTSFWPLIDPALFVSIIDMIEDVMQMSLPSFIEAVRVSDFGLGTNPLRILSMRALPNESVDPKKDENGTKMVSEYINYEIQFSYAATAGRTQREKSHNIHLMLEFFVGMLDWIRFPVKIWAQVEALTGTARIRMQLIPQFPYVGEVTYTLLGIPKLDVSIYPLSKKMPNVLDLPVLKGFVRQSIAAGLSTYVAPASGVLDIAAIMAPYRIGEVNALGVFVITIHYCRSLADKDGNDKSDPYIVLAYAKFGKPLYSTRIITEDLNPSFEETTVLMLTQNEVDAEEDLSAMLWDSDDRTADDLLGRVKIPVKELIKEPGVVHKREDKLIGFEDADSMNGSLCWSIAYHPRLPLNKNLERPPPEAEKQQQQEEQKCPPDSKGDDKLAKPPSEPVAPPDVLRTPPDPEWPSGVLRIVLHQIYGLEHQELRGNMGKNNREGRAGQDTDEPEEEGNNLPSSYCEFVVNDDLVYKTRVKQYTSMPFFEAGTEVFVRDWTKAQVRIVVRDALLRESDPILGIVSLNVADVLKNSSEATGLHALQEGVGFGRASISVLFKSVEVKLPKPLLGWDTATVEVLPSVPIELTITTPQKDEFKKLILSTTDSTEKLAKPNASNKWTIDEPVRLPVYARYASAFFVELREGGFELIDRGPDAVALLWLKDIEEDKEMDVDLPVWVGKNLRILKQNVITDAFRETHKCEQIGTLRVRIKLDPGLDMDHEKTAHSQARKHAFETYDHAQGQADVAENNSHAGDDGVIDKDEKEAIDKAEKRQLQNRQRGPNGYKPYRTVKWMAHGIKDRVKPERQAKREPAVHTEEDT